MNNRQKYQMFLRIVGVEFRKAGLPDGVEYIFWDYLMEHGFDFDLALDFLRRGYNRYNGFRYVKLEHLFGMIAQVATGKEPFFCFWLYRGFVGYLSRKYTPKIYNLDTSEERRVVGWNFFPCLFQEEDFDNVEWLEGLVFSHDNADDRLWELEEENIIVESEGTIYNLRDILSRLDTKRGADDMDMLYPGQRVRLIFTDEEGRLMLRMAEAIGWGMTDEDVALVQGFFRRFLVI